MDPDPRSSISGTADEICAPQVDIDHPLPTRRFLGVDRQKIVANTGRVENEIDAAQPGVNLVHHPLDGLRVSDIAADMKRGPGLFQRGLGGLRIDIGNDDLGSKFVKQPCGGRPDAACAAGHQRGAAAEVEMGTGPVMHRGRPLALPRH